MIREVRVVGLKRFADQTFPFAPLTLLTGLNGTGKTSLIHALLLAREASIQRGSSTVRLNGPFGLELGTAESVRNWDSDGEIEIVMRDDLERSHRWAFLAPPQDALHLTILAAPEPPPVAFTPELRGFTYLCAERFGPRSTLSSSAMPAEEVEVGVRGEYCAQVLASLGGRPGAFPERRHPVTTERDASLLKYDVERWLSDVVRPTELEAEVFPGTSVTALRYRVPGGEWVRAPNMGFGVTYALPIVLAGLTTPKSGILIVENPEAHLHPAGQSRMGFFLATLAACGLQVVVETHSDHVLNGLRRAIGEQAAIAASGAIVHYFDASEGDKPRVQTLSFTPTGGLLNWPRGFFDQYQTDVAALTRMHRRK